ncbi:HAD-IA family hydrolase [Martelella radicis]|uniref:Phosphoglycolate phosphatase n=1 Tax=Martelella radicis TaxID=1397476 RepID=A0A7W6KI52_9HYPH|nr:HAD-IA family hydrolase [Martelella radicis]MBB4120398.1 phosphoglycolate phosphatase [Martelella radicis]
MKLVLFDCDGTLVDSLAIIQETMARTFRAFGHDAPDEHATRGTVGLTLDVAIAGLLGRDQVDHECRDMMGYYRSLFVEVRRDPAMQEKLYEGISAMLSHLFLQDDILVGAVTGKSRRGLDHMLKTHGYADKFITTRTADDCPSKPHPAMVLECCDETGMRPEQAVVIGDTVFDIQMAKSAGAGAVGVSWGYGAPDALRLAGAAAIAETPDDILKFVLKGA